MKQQRKSKFFTFIFSLIPGAAEMYMGFMKSGVSLMGLFFLGFIVPNVLGVYGLTVYTILIWFYSFFHARNLAALNDFDFQNMQDDFFWNEFIGGRKIQISNPTLRKWGAAILIVTGVALLWNNISSVCYQFVPDYLWEYAYSIMEKIPQVAIAVLIIVIGIRLIAGKKEEIYKDGE